MQLYNEPLTDTQKAAITALADDMECGAKLHPKGTGILFQSTHLGVGNGWQVHTCALGAAYACRVQRELGSVPTILENPRDIGTWNTMSADGIMALYGIEDNYPDHRYNIPFPDGSKYKTPTNVPLSEIIWTMNDQLDMSREQIAAWLRTLE